MRKIRIENSQSKEYLKIMRKKNVLLNLEVISHKKEKSWNY